MEIPQNSKNSHCVTKQSTSGYISKMVETRILKDILTNMFIALAFKIVKRWEKPRCSLMGE